MIKKIISYIISFMITILLFLLLGIIIMNTTILNEDYIINALDKNNYYEKTYNKITSNFEGYIISTGLDKNIANTIITQDKVKNDIQTTIKCIYQNQPITIDTTTIRNELDKSINQKISETGKQLTTEDKQNIDTFKHTIEETYQNHIVYFNDNIKTIQNYFTKIIDYLNIATIIISIATIILYIVIIIINRNLKNNINYLITSLLGASLLSTTIGIYFQDKFNKIQIFTQEFTDVLVDTINNIFSNLFTYGLIISIINIVILIIINIPHEKKN